MRMQDRRLLRNDDRVRVRAQVQHQEGSLFRLEERVQARGLVMGPERVHEQPLYPVPWRRLLQVPEQRPHRGQALAQPSRGREKLGQCRSQNADTRSQNPLKGKDLEHEDEGEVRRQKPDARSQKCGRRPRRNWEPGETKRQEAGAK